VTHSPLVPAKAGIQIQPERSVGFHLGPGLWRDERSWERSNLGRPWSRPATPPASGPSGARGRRPAPASP